MALYTPVPEAKGWLWRQLGGNWLKFWAVLRGGTLEFYSNTQVRTMHSAVHRLLTLLHSLCSGKACLWPFAIAQHSACKILYTVRRRLRGPPAWCT